MNLLPVSVIINSYVYRHMLCTGENALILERYALWSAHAKIIKLIQK